MDTCDPYIYVPLNHMQFINVRLATPEKGQRSSNFILCCFYNMIAQAIKLECKMCEYLCVLIFPNI